MVLAFSWASSGRPAWRASRSNQGTLARPTTARAHRAQASQAGHRCFLVARIAGQGGSAASGERYGTLSA
jgi:hypothetical protein